MIDGAFLTIVEALAAGVMLGVWYGRNRPMHIASRQVIPLHVAQEHDRKVRAERAQAFEEFGERYYFVTAWDRDSKLPGFYSNGHKTIEDARQAAQEHIRRSLGSAEIWDVKVDKPIERVLLDGDRISSVAL